MQAENKSMQAENKNMQTENKSHKHLAQTKIFRAALGIPIAAGVILAIFIAFSTDLGKLCFEEKCVQRFFDIFKFPIAAAGLSLPLVAMVAAIHRSIEASTQIDVAIKQFGEAISNNRFGNYLKHRESFDKLMDGFCARESSTGTKSVQIQSAILYSRVFPDSGSNKVEWTGQHSESYMDSLHRHVDVVLAQSQKSAQDFELRVFLSSLKKLNNTLRVTYADSVLLSLPEEGGGKSVAIDILVPKTKFFDISILNAASDCLEAFILIRSYVGINDSKFVWEGFDTEKLLTSLEVCKGRCTLAGEKIS